MITIIPAIDIIDGKCVRLSKGDFDTRITYFDDPLEIAGRYEQAGIKRLHVVDLDGAKQKKVVNWDVLKRLKEGTQLEIDFGGGIQSEAELERVFGLGIPMVSLGSIAVRQPETMEAWRDRFGADRIIIAADFRDGYVAVSGWKEATRLTLDELIRERKEQGFRRYLCTDIARDGMLSGPAFETYARLKDRFPEIELIASGGISRIEDVEQLNNMGMDAVIIGKAIYENKISLEQLEPYLC